MEAKLITSLKAKTYKDMLLLMNTVIQEAPSYSKGEIGPPFYMILYEAMNTDGGFTAFMSDKLNEQFKRIFDEWAQFLISPYSTNVLTEDEDGWFSPAAITALEYGFDGLSFPQIFDCDASKPHYGYTSWDDFFVRALNPGVRSLELPDATNVISAACESVFYNVASNVKETDAFWVKGEPYSLRHMLNHDEEYATLFNEGTIFQGFLQMTGYHRWHAPVDGTIQKIVTVPGTYFVQSPALLGTAVDDAHPPYLRSLAFNSSLATRMLIFIESSNPAIGMMCFIAVGLTEVSTCEATVEVGGQVKRGDELGMFHFGGSTHCLVFQKGAEIQWDGVVTGTPGNPIKVRQAIGASTAT